MRQLFLALVMLGTFSGVAAAQTGKFPSKECKLVQDNSLRSLRAAQAWFDQNAKEVAEAQRLGTFLENMAKFKVNAYSVSLFKSVAGARFAMARTNNTQLEPTVESWVGSCIIN